MAVAPLRRRAQNPAYRVTLTPLFTGAGTAAHGPAGGVPGEKRFSRPPPIRRPLPLVAPYLAAAFPQELNNLGKIAWSGCQIPNSWYKSRMEFVWVVPRAALFSKAAVHGFAPLQPADFEKQFSKVSRSEGFFVERRMAEITPAWKQPIPYVAVTCEDTVFTMTRLTGGEARLHGKRSIGVGGHINPCDQEASGVDGLLAAACTREIDEEIILPAGPQQLEPLGLLNDDTTEVGAVHVGVVYRLVLTPAQADQLRIRETESLAGEFLPYSELVSLAEQDDSPFESWSTLLLRSGALASASAPSMSLA